MKKGIFGVIVLILLGVGGFFGYKYYSETYKTTTAYTKIPAEVPEKTKSKNSDGKIIAGEYSYHYDVIFVKADGKATKRTFSVSGEAPQPLKPGSYVQADISDKRTSSPRVIAEEKIPKKIKDKVDELN
ncbi:hypothetical protein IGL04_001432 [Enterococcus sp. AZ085]|uniref:DUF1093 domain-containing protein n=1 Tax=unclassified Enterococcus TaxID=2608891 RepID=UPI003F288565